MYLHMSQKTEHAEGRERGRVKNTLFSPKCANMQRNVFKKMSLKNQVSFGRSWLLQLSIYELCQYATMTRAKSGGVSQFPLDFQFMSFGGFVVESPSADFDLLVIGRFRCVAYWGDNLRR